MKNGSKQNDNKTTLRVLKDASQRMIIGKNEISKVTEMIIKSCNTQGTKGSVHKSILLSKIDALERLAVLYGTVSKRYENAAMKLTNGVSEDKVMAKLLPYNVFLNDQIKSEYKSYEQVLSMLRV